MKNATMDFPHQGRVLIAAHPFYSPKSSLALQREIRKDGLLEATASEVVSFVRKYFNGKKSRARDVTWIMRNGGFRGFTGILYDPATRLVSFLDRPVFNDAGFVDIGNLVQRVRDGDFYAQVPFKHAKSNVISWNKVAKYPYLVAWAGGQEGAEKLADLASKHPKKAVQLWVPDVSLLSEENRLLATITGLGSYQGGSELSCGDWYLDLVYHAFGLYRGAAEGSALEKPKETLVPKFRDDSFGLIAQVRSAREEIYTGGLGEIPGRLRAIGRQFSTLRETASQYSGEAHQEVRGYLKAVQNSIDALYQALEDLNNKR